MRYELVKFIVADVLQMQQQDELLFFTTKLYISDIQPFIYTLSLF